MKVKEIAKLTSAPIIVASLCCLSPLILVLFGLSTAAFAGSLADTLYGTYKWYFRFAGLVLLAASLVLYFRRTKGICTIDEVKRRRNEIINTVALVVAVSAIGYVVFLYGVVEYAGVLAGVWGAPRSERSQSVNGLTQTVSAREISFRASDGYRLKGVLWKSEAPFSPAVVLVHQYGSNRHDFDAFVPVLLKGGYTVLAYDIRGFGESQSGPANINDFPKDVAGAVKFLESLQPAPSEIGVIGASVGANVAFVASGSIHGISAAVSLSPSDTGVRGVLMGNDIAGFNPHAIFIASDEREKPDADSIFALSREPKEEKTYPGYGHGVALLQSPQARADVITFLQHRFLTPVPL